LCLDLISKARTDTWSAFEKFVGDATIAASAGRDIPVETLLSGPASGVIGAIYAAELSGYQDLLTLDIGGTSADIAVVRGGQAAYSRDEHVGDFPVIMPTVGVSSIGAGGGSVAWFDRAGLLKVGPQSAGADPGPACYGRGGAEPALTDAFVVSGLVNPDNFVGGRIRLDVGRAREAIGTIGERLGRGVEEAAEAVLEVALANMYAEFSQAMARHGLDPRDFTLVAFGGAGPMHALALAQEIGIPRVLVPRHPGNFSALGLLASDIKHDDVRTRVGPLRERRAVVGELFSEMDRAARHQLELEGFAAPQQRILRSLDLRYRGQAFELNVALGADGLALDAIEAAFHRQHLGAYGHASPEAAIELVNARLTAYGLVPKPSGERYRSAGASLDDALVARRPVWFDGAPHDCPVWERERLPERAVLRGPAVVEEFGATTVVPPGWGGVVDEHGNLRFEREARA
jgi:N-methylhydantoinase A